MKNMFIFLFWIYFHTECWIKGFLPMKSDDVGYVLNHYKLHLVHFSHLFIYKLHPLRNPLSKHFFLLPYSLGEPCNKRNTKKGKWWHLANILKRWEKSKGQKGKSTFNFPKITLVSRLLLQRKKNFLLLLFSRNKPLITTLLNKIWF